MQISCERCNTVYVLDDKLIPPSGAPVQCTRCGLVFTAKPPAGAVSSPPPPKPTAPPPSAAARLPTPIAPPSGALPPGGDRRATMMFGGGNVPVPPAQASPNATMMFGGGNGPVPPPQASANATMMFGGGDVQAPPPQASPNATMMFGGAPVSPPAAKAPAASPPPAPRPVSAPIPASPVSDARMTQMFGSAPVPLPSQASPNATMMFGKVEHAPAAPTAPAARPAPAPMASPSSTMIFGGTTPGAATAMFGAVPPSAPPGPPPPAVVPPSPVAGNAASTMMFGAVAGLQAPEGERAPALEMPAVPPAPGRAPARRPAQAAAPLQVPAPAPVAPAPVDQTQMGADRAATDPGVASGPVPSWMASTTEPSVDATLPTGPAFAHRPAPAATAPRPRAVPTQPPAPLSMPRSPEAGLPGMSGPLVGSQTMELQMTLKRRQRLLPVVVGVVVGVAILAGAVGLYFKLRTPPADSMLVAEDEKALLLLKRDDEGSIAKAIETWMKLEKTAPEFVPFKANQLIASVFVTQSLRDDLRRYTAQYNDLNKQREKLETKKAPADWLERAKKLREEMVQLKAKVDPLQDQAARQDETSSDLLKKAKTLVEKLGLGGDGPAVFRASALYYGCKGHESAEKLAEVYRTVPDKRAVLHDPQRAFADLAIAARYAQQRITPGDRDKGVAAAEAALKKDPQLLRAHVFLAKIYLANREFEAARAETEKLLGKNPNHSAAARLKVEIDEAEAQAASKSASEKATE
ncbi:MAG: zinc-ribbon domain-containing protein [Deltaproteobacteria bacterium]|nr:zinc-ribbon domain-containing protein [Deltaproteobacteria bacterium]